MSVEIEGQTVNVGDMIGFKCDIEQYGIIQKIERRWDGKKELIVTPAGEHFQGEYLSRTQRTHRLLASDCWVE